MNARKLTLAVAGTMLAFAIAAAPATRKEQVVVIVGAQPTPYSADHARIGAPAEEQPAQF